MKKKRGDGFLHFLISVIVAAVLFGLSKVAFFMTYTLKHPWQCVLYFLGLGGAACIVGIFVNKKFPKIKIVAWILVAMSLISTTFTFQCRTLYETDTEHYLQFYRKGSKPFQSLAERFMPELDELSDYEGIAYCQVERHVEPIVLSWDVIAYLKVTYSPEDYPVKLSQVRKQTCFDEDTAYQIGEETYYWVDLEPYDPDLPNSNSDLAAVIGVNPETRDIIYLICDAPDYSSMSDEDALEYVLGSVQNGFERVALMKQGFLKQLFR